MGSGGARGLCARHYKEQQRGQGRDTTYNRKREQQEAKKKHVEEKRALKNAMRRVRDGSSRWVQMYTDLPGYHGGNEATSWTETAEALQGMHENPCGWCGCPPTGGPCPICSKSHNLPRLMFSFPKIVIEVLPEQYFSGRLYRRPPKKRRVVKRREKLITIKAQRTDWGTFSAQTRRA